MMGGRTLEHRLHATSGISVWSVFVKAPFPLVESRLYFVVFGCFGMVVRCWFGCLLVVVLLLLLDLEWWGW